MKKKLISAAFVVAIALTAGYNVYNSQNKVALSDLALDNVEALASGESSPNDCIHLCNEDFRYTCIIDWKNGSELITCIGYRPKSS